MALAKVAWVAATTGAGARPSQRLPRASESSGRFPRHGAPHAPWAAIDTIASVAASPLGDAEPDEHELKPARGQGRPGRTVARHEALVLANGLHAASRRRQASEGSHRPELPMKACLTMVPLYVP